MDKKYVTGLVVGKFCPLHNGHVYLIETALAQCEKVIVLSYTSQYFPGCDANTRTEWLLGLNRWLDLKPHQLEVHVIDHLVHAGVQDDSPAEAHREFCADYLFETLDTTVQAVFTSEDYGQGFAEHLTKYFSAKVYTPVQVDHVIVDLAREKFPVSGTQLRNCAATSKNINVTLVNLTPPHVHPYFVRKVLFLGAESTGKTTITKAVGEHFNAQTALEFGRYMYDKRNGKLQYEDMFRIAKGQIEVEDYRALHSVPGSYLFCDTSPLTTLFYTREWFGRVPSKLTDLVYNCDERYYKIYVCAPDFPMVQDGTRQDEAFRQQGHEFYIDELTGAGRAGQEYTLLTGTLEDRIKKVILDLTTYQV